ncbi:MAG: SCP2 sterol-binding domain-containing protein [Micavibrio aeruginosavorus]|uniref:SCP2 sterol-binding domain-containing protein n=1 Tax=Micavibrio aeruginosavorus TaxID=349221 RepID=A0A7T5R4H6_9BACT|nr:MAG: SCP2 sterol-binding domain-containing protein [Micavibrio aeruginosavorus]
MAYNEMAAGPQFSFQNLPRRLLAPLPLPLLQPILSRVIRKTAENRPELFGRLGIHQNKTYLVDPTNMPFVFLLTPDSSQPRLRACRRGRHAPSYDARIAGTFLTLLNMIDGSLDGDALFFTRDLIVEGDTEAVVVLRNALDDLDGSIVDDLADQFGPLGRAAVSALRRIRRDS